MDVGAAWPVRVGWWMGERFPPVVYTLLVLVFHWAAVSSARGLTGTGGLALPAAVVAWLLFFHLRVFDEHKDFEADVLAYPQRVLSRGLVTLPLLARLGAVAIGVEAVLAAMLGRDAWLAWALAFGFSVAMRFEFGLGAYLRDRLVLYAITHNPVVGLLTFFLWTATGAPFHLGLVALLLLCSAGSFGFELGRKIRLPEEEHAGVPSYSSVLGHGRARALLLLTHTITGGALVWLVVLFGWSVPAALGFGALAAAPGVFTAAAPRRAKVVDAGASGTLLLGLVIASLTSGAW